MNQCPDEFSERVGPQECDNYQSKSSLVWSHIATSMVSKLDA